MEPVQPVATARAARILHAALVIGSILVGIAFFRPRIPQRRMDQGPDEYWLTNEARGAAVIVWATVEAAGLIAWVGYFLTGRAVPAAVAALAVVTLITLRPSRLEGDGAS